MLAFSFVDLATYEVVSRLLAEDKSSLVRYGSGIPGFQRYRLPRNLHERSKRNFQHSAGVRYQGSKHRTNL